MVLLRTLNQILQDENKTALFIEEKNLTKTLHKNSIQYVEIGISGFYLIPVYVSNNHFIVEMNSCNEVANYNTLRLAVKAISKNLGMDSIIGIDSVIFNADFTTNVSTATISVDKDLQIVPLLPYDNNNRKAIDVYLSLSKVYKNNAWTIDKYLKLNRQVAKPKVTSKFKSFIKKYIPWM